MEEKEIVDIWAASGFSDEKLAELKQMHPTSEALLMAERIIKEGGQLTPKFTTAPSAIWAGIEARINTPKVAQPSRGLRFRTVWLAAAAIALLAVLTLVLKPSDNAEFIDYATAKGETETVNLPDGSIAYLSSTSELSYDNSTWGKARSLTLKGEAFFEVEKGESFSVTTSEGVVRVLGTSFNVKARNNILEVECKTGKVEVTSGKNKTLLEPGHFIIYSQTKQLKGGSHPIENMGAWREGKFYFTDVKVSEALSEFARQFDYTVKISDPELQKINYTGFFNLTSPEQALNSICLPLGLTYEIQHETKTVRINP